jgi:hypothetical protein
MAPVAAIPAMAPAAMAPVAAILAMTPVAMAPVANCDAPAGKAAAKTVTTEAATTETMAAVGLRGNAIRPDQHCSNSLELASKGPPASRRSGSKIIGV